MTDVGWMQPSQQHLGYVCRQLCICSGGDQEFYLPVTTGNDRRAGALGVGQSEEPDGFVVGSRRGTFRQHVGA